MKKLIPFIILLLLTTFLSSIGLKRNPKSDLIIETIKNKYEEIMVQSPSVKAKGKEVAKKIRFIQPEDQTIHDYSKLKQIALVRHGEPDMKHDGKFTKEEANQYLKCYDSVCIIVPEEPFFEVNDDENVKVFSSPINRALSTAQYIFGTNNDISTSPIFREFENSINSGNKDKKKSMKFWKLTSRVKWMLGGGKESGKETFKDAKKRAKEAALILNQASSENPKVLLTAHGFINRYIEKNLKKMGWKVVNKTGKNYLGTTILVKIED